MYQNDTLNNILRLVEQRRLGRAITDLENFLLSNPKLKRDMELLIAVQSDYKLLTDYWQRGFDDPQRQEIYDKLLRRMYVQTTNIIIHQRLAASTFMMSVYQRPRQIRKDWSMTSLRGQLEAFVSDVAMLQLEPAATRQERRRTIYREHQLLVHDLFDYIITSRSWNDSLAATFTEMLLLPTIDTNDQQLIVSAITLSLINAFDIGKFNVLMNVYRQTHDMALRQRALVGWALCLGGASTAVYPEVQAKVTEVCQDATNLDELTELQMQLFFCMDAEEDQRKIHDEIMPDILSGSNIKITRHGLVEMDEDTLDDILHPDKAEEGMERMEHSMRRMIDMQKQGADIYFGGFSQMKRFPFYNDLSNWFVPFYHEHPAVCNIWDNTKGKRFLQTITAVGAFCDSDKYSFVLAFDQVLRQFPAKMLKMIEDGEASAQPLGGEIAIEEQQQPAFVRRMYLQNMYRFFRLFSMRSEFVNPFDSQQHYAFFAASTFKGSRLEQRMPQVAAFLMKRRRYEEAMSVLSSSAAKGGFDYNLLMGSLLMHLPMSTALSATDYFRQALRERPDNEQALSGYARAAFRYQNYEVALSAYQQLMDKHPDHRGYILNAAICHANMENTDEALKLLFKLDYEQPDDMKAKRVLAWVLTVADRYEQASKHFLQLLALPQPQPVDMLNYGYCLWFQGQVADAITYFKQFLASKHDESFSLENEFKFTEYKLLSRHNISNIEIELMLDALA